MAQIKMKRSNNISPLLFIVSLFILIPVVYFLGFSLLVSVAPDSHEQFDPSQPPHEKVIVSFTTLPQRIKFLEHTIQSLAYQTTKPDLVIIAVPVWSKRFKRPYVMTEINDTISDMCTKYNINIRLLVSQTDYGPGCKLVPVLSVVDPTDIIVYIDDDGIYGNKLVEVLVDTVRAYPDNVIANGCGNVYQYGLTAKHKIPEGAWGVALRANVVNADELRKFMNEAHDTCFGCDDYLFAEFFAQKGIRVLELPQKITVQQLEHGFKLDALHNMESTPVMNMHKRYGKCARTFLNPKVLVHG